MGLKVMKLELIWNLVGKRLMIRSVFFAMILALMPALYIIQEGGRCHLDSKPLFGAQGPGIGFSKRQRVQIYSTMYRDLLNRRILRRGLKGLCAGAGARDSARALRQYGLPCSVIDRRCDFRRLPFADKSFDFVYSGSLDRVRAPALLAMEIERILKTSGVAVAVVSPWRMGQDSNPIHSLSPVAALFRNSGVTYATGAGNFSVIALRKRSYRPKPLEFANPCSKQNRSLIDLAEPVTRNHKNQGNHSSTIYLPSLVDLRARDRHVYVEVGSNDTERSISVWFREAYPKQNRTFEIYVLNVDETLRASHANLSGVSVVPRGILMQGSGRGFEIGRWVRAKVGDDVFVVVKVGLEDVRGMIESGVLCHVDELFVVCKENQNADCLSMLHTLRYNGVFAHKW